MESNKTLQNETLKKLTVRQTRAILAVLAAPSIERGCRDAGVSRKTFYSWLQDPVFREEFDRQRGEITDNALKRLTAAADKAVQTLLALLDSKKEHIRARVAESILEHIRATRETDKIISRLDELEKLAKSR